MRFAYADPPYVGVAHRYPEKTEVDQARDEGRVVDEFPDGWALSCSSPSLRLLLPLCPEDTRVMAWVKPFAAFKPGVNPAYAWEPVLVCGGRRQDRTVETVRDWVSSPITLKRGMVGAKPDAFCYWLFRVLGMERDDDLIDLFPGTGAVSRTRLL